MSKITDESPKHCGHKKEIKLHKLNKKLWFYISSSILTILSLIFVVWLILRPTKPQFSLKEADINQLNLSGPSLLNSSIQLTLISINPNKKVGIYYDEFLLYASYKGQKITPETPISPFYQEHEESNLLSASLVGLQQPVSPSFAYEVQRDQGTGKLALSFKVMGRLRWKVGTWVSGRKSQECHDLIAKKPSSSPLGISPFSRFQTFPSQWQPTEIDRDEGAKKQVIGVGLQLFIVIFHKLQPSRIWNEFGMS